MARVPSDTEIQGALSVVMQAVKDALMKVVDSIPQAAESREQIEYALDQALAKVDWATLVAASKTELLGLLLTGQSEVDNQPSDLA